jgi:hypothetical protein
MGVKCQVYYPVFAIDDEVNFLLLCSSRELSTSGARSALPMGVASEAIVKLFLFEYRLKVSSNVSIIFDLQKILFSS